MATTIQIKRRVGSAGTPGTLAEGELAFHDPGGGPAELYIGTTPAAILTLVSNQRQVELAGAQTITGLKTFALTALSILGGAAGYVLTTDGSGNLSWAAQSGGGGAPSTGDLKPTHNPTAPSGWILWNDGTIGDGSSGASNRANADTQNLFNIYYASPYTDTSCPLLTSTGAATTRSAQGTAAAAWAAHCRMSLPKGAGRLVGNIGSGSGLTTRTSGDALGAESKTQATVEMPSHYHGSIGYPNVDTADSWSAWTNSGIALVTLSSTAATGGGATFSLMNPVSFAYWMIKL